MCLPGWRQRNDDVALPLHGRRSPAAPRASRPVLPSRHHLPHPGVPHTPHARPQVWLRAVRYRLASGDAEGARKTLDRSLQSLPQFEHIRMISQTGLLEFKIGDAGGLGTGRLTLAGVGATAQAQQPRHLCPCWLPPLPSRTCPHSATNHPRPPPPLHYRVMHPQSAGAASLRACCATTPSASTCGACTWTKRWRRATRSAYGAPLLLLLLLLLPAAAAAGPSGDPSSLPRRPPAAAPATPPRFVCRARRRAIFKPCVPGSPLPLLPLCRALFERATHLQLPPKKMKFLFKRYLDYEKAHGTAAGVEHVKKRALEYVEAQAAA